MIVDDADWMSTDCLEAGDGDHYHENCEDPMDCACPCHEEATAP